MNEALRSDSSEQNSTSVLREIGSPHRTHALAERVSHWFPGKEVIRSKDEEIWVRVERGVSQIVRPTHRNVGSEKSPWRIAVALLSGVDVFVWDTEQALKPHGMTLPGTEA